MSRLSGKSARLTHFKAGFYEFTYRQIGVLRTPSFQWYIKDPSGYERFASEAEVSLGRELYAYEQADAYEDAKHEDRI